MAIQKSADAVSRSARRFHERAELYGELDARLHQKTRFFGAACMTNRVLGHMASRIGHLWCSDPTCGWLAATGAVLEKANVAIAAALDRGSLTGDSLDARIVSLEQSILEDALRRPTTTDLPREVLPELNTCLNYGCGAARLHLRFEVRWYSRVLASVRKQLSAPLDFAVLAHREAIGLALIAHLRRDRL